MVWVFEWTYPADNEVDIQIYHKELDAFQSACADIIEYINNIFDMTDANNLQAAKEINILVQSSQYQEAVEYFHEYIQNNFVYDDLRYFHVYEKDVHNQPKRPQSLTLLSTLGEEEETAEETCNVVKEGATCRGPCKQHYEYALADKCDGTFVCRSCKLMNQFFAGKAIP